MGRLRRVPFGLPFWGYTFPLAAASALAIHVSSVLPGWAYVVVAAVLLAVATLVVTAVLVLALRAAVRRQICVPE